MATEWFEKERNAQVARGLSDPRMVLVGDGVPDWVRAPAELQAVLGAAPLKVRGSLAAPCPMCRDDRDVRHLYLDAGYGVAECHGRCGYVWYRLRDAEAADGS